MRQAMRNAVWTALTAAAGLMLSGAAEARLFVLKSDVAVYPVRSVIEPDQKLNLPNGKRLTVLLPDGTMRDLTSANNGPVQALLKTTKPASWWDDLVKMVMSGGGTDKPGSVRSIAVPVSLAVEGVRGSKVRVCIGRGSVPAVSRDRAGAGQAVSFVAGANGKPVSAEFASGESTLKWPSGVEVTDGQTYRLTPVSGAAMEVQLTLLPKGLQGAEALQALAGAGCLPQAAAALQAMSPQ